MLKLLHGLFDKKKNSRDKGDIHSNMTFEEESYDIVV